MSETKLLSVDSYNENGAIPASAHQGSPGIFFHNGGKKGVVSVVMPENAAIEHAGNYELLGLCLHLLTSKHMPTVVKSYINDRCRVMAETHESQKEIDDQRKYMERAFATFMEDAPITAPSRSETH